MVRHGDDDIACINGYLLYRKRSSSIDRMIRESPRLDLATSALLLSEGSSDTRISLEQRDAWCTPVIALLREIGEQRNQDIWIRVSLRGKLLPESAARRESGLFYDDAWPKHLPTFVAFHVVDIDEVEVATNVDDGRRSR